MKYLRIIFWILGIPPLGFSFSILTFYIHAGKILGQSPYYNQPDPKEIDVYTTYSPLVDWTATIWLLSFPIWLGLLILHVVLKKKGNNWRPILITGSSQILAILMLFSKVFEWYID